jgi:hypothetical protein
LIIFRRKLNKELKQETTLRHVAILVINQNKLALLERMIGYRLDIPGKCSIPHWGKRFNSTTLKLSTPCILLILYHLLNNSMHINICYYSVDPPTP